MALNWYLGNITEQGVTVEVPDLMGFNPTELETIVAEKELRYEIIDSVYFADKPRGVVISQSPAAGKQVKRDRKIYLTINANKVPRVTLPNIVDMTLRQATGILNSLGIQVNDLIYEPNLCSGCIVRMERNNEELMPGYILQKGAKIDLVVGAGLTGELVPYPVVIGKKYLEAYNILRRRGLNVGAVTYEDCLTKSDSAEALIIMQIPDFTKAELVPMGQSVSLTLTKDVSKIPAVEVDSAYRLVKIVGND
jgi:beta-lactam-binding protein with PASTA domain